MIGHFVCCSQCGLFLNTRSCCPSFSSMRLSCHLYPPVVPAPWLFFLLRAPLLGVPLGWWAMISVCVSLLVSIWQERHLFAHMTWIIYEDEDGSGIRQMQHLLHEGWGVRDEYLTVHERCWDIIITLIRAYRLIFVFHPSIHPSIHLSIHLYIHLFTH